VQLCSHQPAGRCMPHLIATCTSWQMHATSHCHMHQLADACHIALPHAPACRCMPHHIATCGWLQRSIPQCRD
jgi:hypothetical protein